jgi:hypothetical protein
MPANNSLFDLSVLNKLHILSTTASTSSTTGALVIEGGLGVVGNLNVQGTITGGEISYASTTTGTLNVSNGSGTTFTCDSTTDSTSVGTGSTVLLGGASIAKNLYVGGTLVAGSVVYSSTSTGSMDITTGTGTTLTVSSADDSTSTTNGSAVFAGGVGIQKRMNVGSIKSFDTTQATSTSTGSIQTSGGIGCAGNIYTGGLLVSTSSTSSTSTTTGALVITGGIGVQGTINSSNAKLWSNVNSSSTSTGTLVVVGGVGISATLNADTINSVQSINNGGFDFLLGTTDQSTRGNSGASRAMSKLSGNVLCINFDSDYSGGTLIDSSLFLGGPLTSSDTTISASTTTGSVVLAGGLGVGGKIFTGSLQTTDTTEATSTTNASVIFPGGLAVAKKIFSNTMETTLDIVNGGFNLILGTADQVSRGNTGLSRALVKETGGRLFINYAADFTGGLVLNSATNCTGPLLISDTSTGSSTSTGALVVAGDAGVQGVLNVENIHVYDTTEATSKTSASTVFEGGVGISKKLFCNNLETTGGVINGGFDFTLGTTDQVTRGNTGLSRALVKIDGGYLYINYASDFSQGVVLNSKTQCTGQFVVLDSTTSTSTTTGALVVAGGIGVQGPLYSSNIVVSDTTESTSKTTGSIITEGGIGIQKALFCTTSNSDYLNVLNTDDSTSITAGPVVFSGGIAVAKSVFSTSLNTVASINVGGFDISLGTTDQTTRGNTNASRVLVKDYYDSKTQLHVNYERDFNQIVLGSNTTVFGTIVAENFNSYPLDLTVTNVDGSFQESLSFKMNVNTLGSIRELVCRYSFVLPFSGSVAFDTTFTSTQTLIHPYCKQIMGTGFVSVFNPPYFELPDYPYDHTRESFYIYPISAVLRLEQNSPTTSGGVLDPSTGFTYRIRTYASNPSYIQGNDSYSTMGSADRSVFQYSTPDASYNPTSSTFEIQFKFTMPVIGYDNTFIDYGLGDITLPGLPTGSVVVSPNIQQNPVDTLDQNLLHAPKFN